jgi:hypothetical protein
MCNKKKEVREKCERRMALNALSVFSFGTNDTRYIFTYGK